MLLPVLLPFLFDFAVIIDAHGFLGPLLKPRRGDDLAKIDLFRHRPKAAQIVELPGFLGEYMNDQAAVIQQLPGIAPVAFPAQGASPGFLQSVLGEVAERPHMGCWMCRCK